jgi:hypothetical protein
VVPDILAQQNSAPLQCSFAVTPLIALVGRVAFNQGGDGSIKVTAERSALYRVPFETGQDSGFPAEQMVLVKGENTHLRFVGSPGEETGIPLKKRRN